MKKSNELALYLKRLKRRTFFLFLFLFFISALFSRVPIESVKTSSPPKIDGVLDDPVWKRAKGYSDFLSLAPDIGKPPKEKTIVYVAYDADNLYFAFKCFDSEPDKIIATVTKRDTILREDFVEVFIDSHNDGQNAYMFFVNPLGIQMDGIIDSDADNNDWSPDFLWESMGVKNAEGYVVEMKVPFKTLRFSRAKVVKMKVGFSRGIPRYTEQYIFPEYRPGKGAFVVQFGLLQLEDINYKQVFEVLPAVTYMNRKTRDNNDNLVSSVERSLGFTSKIGVTSDLTLDMTLNPDFSHIEIDEGQVDVNLRAELLFEEKRPFFLEGLEHFNFAGCGNENPLQRIVNTRKIIEPSWGLKLSGKIGKSNIVNSLFAVDKSQEHSDALEPGVETGNRYFGIFRYKHLFKNDSYVGAVYTGKEFKIYSGEKNTRGFNHVAGLDSRIRLSGFMIFDAFFLYSFNKRFYENSDRIDNTEGEAFGGRWNYVSRNYYASLGFHELSTNFELASGWLIRNGIRTFSATAERNFYPRPDFLKQIILGYSGSLSRDIYFDLNEYSHQFFASFSFSAATKLFLGYDFATEVYEGVVFDTNTFSMAAESRPTKYLQLQLIYNSGGQPNYNPSDLFQGNIKQLNFSVNFQPGRKFSTKFTIKREIFHRDIDDKRVYDVGIYRNKTTFNLNKYLLIRGIVEYNNYYKVLLWDSLVEFTYIPGTLIHLGYGSTYDRGFIANQLFKYEKLRETSGSFFFKASYRFRF